MRYLFSNNATSRLKIDTPAGSATITVPNGEGEKFPNPTAPDFFMVTLDDRRTGQMEICKCTARNGDSLVVLRGQEGTLAQDFIWGAVVSQRMTAGTLNWVLDEFYNATSYTKTEADARFINADGDSMTGPLIVQPPTNIAHAASKQYVDDGLVTKAPIVHTHLMTDVVGLDGALAGKAPIPSPTGEYIMKNGTWTVLTWTELDGKPTTFPPTLPIATSDVTNLDNQLTAINNQIATKIGDAPNDGQQYIRQSQLWQAISIPDTSDFYTKIEVDSKFVMSGGDVMSGPLMLHGAPTVDAEAATKLYVDTNDLALSAAITALQGDKEPIIATGDPAMFWAGDKTWKAPPSGGGGGIPEAPTDGQQYARQMAAWAVVTGGGGGGIPEPPAGANVYARQNGAWILTLSQFDINNGLTAKVNKNGDTMSGPLILNADPIANLGAATKQYVDGFATNVWNKAQSDARYEPLDSAYTKAESDARYTGVGVAYTKAESDTRYVDVGGDTMTGALTLIASVTGGNQATTKNYVDNAVNSRELLITAGTTSQYWRGDKSWQTINWLTDAPNDGKTYGRKSQTWSEVIAGAVISDTPPASPVDGSFWWESDTGVLYLRYNDGNTSQWVQAGGGGGGQSVASLGTIVPRNLTISTSAPSGGSNGDLWMKVV